MKQFFIYYLFLLLGLISQAQQEFHVFPKQHQNTPGTKQGNGSLANPWDLQTALSQSSSTVKSGDTIWLHQGVYNGRFVSTLESLEPDQFITVSAFKNDKVVLNGNVSSSRNTVLEVKGKQVVYKDFEITFLGDYSRYEKDDDFEVVSGMRHITGEDCQFLNLKVYNNPGLGIGSWKATGGSVFDGCIIYNNGYITEKGEGSGEGIYTQNMSNKTRVIQNCILFNNYYKGIEVWSANKKAENEYVKNYEIKSNVIFNNGSPAQKFKDNLIIASGDNNGINIAKNIKVHSNVFYHNTDTKNSEINGDAASLTLGFNENSPVENITIKNNIIIGRNNALRILHAKSLIFENNKVYSGYVTLQSSVLDYITNWTFKNNAYFTKKSSSFRIAGDKDYSLQSWQTNFGLDQDSSWKNIKQFDMKSFVSITKYKYQAQTYKLVIFKDDGKQVIVDFSKYDIKTNSVFTIYDVENPNVVLKRGVLNEDYKITFPMQLTTFEKPLHNSLAKKTLSNFGVFIIEFEAAPVIEDTIENDNIFKRFFKWLGF